jgi:formylglycine-generating enzyme required for sulfatase activity
VRHITALLLLTLILIGCNNKPEVIRIIDTPSNLPTEPGLAEGSSTGKTTFIPTGTPSNTPEPISTSTIEVFILDTKISEIDQMKMVYIPGGVFNMGGEDGWDSEKPVHPVKIKAFWMDQTEVTNRQYGMCVGDEDCSLPGILRSYGRENYYSNPEFGNYPVINVSWYDAVSYCTWAGRRLPTEAEWEMAAKGDEARTYPWGNTIDCTKANYIDCPWGDTTMVGSFPAGASPYGVLDMAGNVWEWVGDWYDPLYYDSYPLDYPSGPESGAYRVVRGGSWNDYEFYLRTTNRYSYFPENKRFSVGFRCVLDAVE